MTACTTPLNRKPQSRFVQQSDPHWILMTPDGREHRRVRMARVARKTEAPRSPFEIPTKTTICAIVSPGNFVLLALLLIGLSCWTGRAAAAAPEIHVATSAEEVFIGDSIDYQVEIRNIQNPSAPDVSALKDLFDVVASGDESRDQSSISIINGRVTKQSVLSHIYQFRLTPKGAGNLTIPPVKITIDGKTLTSDEVPLRVIAPEEQDLVLAEITTSHMHVYPTQPFTVTLKVLVQPLPNSPTQDPLTPLKRRPPHIQVNWVDPPAGLSSGDKANWLQPLLSDDGVGFTLNDVNTRSGSFFDGPRAAVLNLRQGRETREGFDGTGIKYFVYELKRTFTPERTGTYTMGPALIKGTFVSGIERKEYTGQKIVTSAPAASVEVREVPSPRPPTFCGGIGEFKASASASPLKLRVGDPLTLTLELVRGSQSGSLELVSAPDISTIEQLAADFDLIDKNPTGRVDGDLKRFAYGLRPKRKDVGIPSLTISTFDPETEQFRTITIPAIPLEVAEADRLTSGELVGTRSSAATSSIKTRSEGIFQNVLDPSELQDQHISLIEWLKRALLIWTVAGALIAMIKLYRHKTSDPGWIRRQQAKSHAQRRLSEARTLAAKGQSSDALRQVRSAIIGLIADLKHRIADGMTTAEVRQVLTSAGVPENDCAEILNLLESIESADYGGGQSAEPVVAIDAAARWITRVAPRLERGTSR